MSRQCPEKSKQDLTAFKVNVTDLRFYTEKNRDKYSFDAYWSVYYSLGKN
jgi:hypothetical protein